METYYSLSLGAGVQSTTMALMLDRGLLDAPKPDWALFADTGWEPEGIYTHLDWLETELSYPVHRVSQGSLRQNLIEGRSWDGHPWVDIPAFIRPRGMLRRQCTTQHKIKPMDRKLRELAGGGKKRFPTATTRVHTYLGISLDEAHRMKDSRLQWQVHRWPLVEAGMTRQDCVSWFSEHYPGRPLVKSACIGCPYHSTAKWVDIYKYDPVSWADAVEVDEAMRADTSPLDKTVYLHRSMMPLTEWAEKMDSQGTLFADDGLMGEECEGICGV